MSMSDKPKQSVTLSKPNVSKPPAPKPDRDLITYLERDTKPRRSKTR